MAYTTTLLVYRNTVKKNLSLETGDDNLEWSDDYITQAVNEAREVFWDQANYHSKPGLAYKNSVLDTAEVDIPDNVDDIKQIRYYDGTSYILLRFLPLDNYLLLTRTLRSGRPYGWTRLGKQIGLYPRPSAAVVNGVQFYGNISLGELAEDTDIDTQIENRWKGLITRYATGLCWLKAEQEAKANTHFAIYEKRFANNSYDIKSRQTDQAVDPSDGVGYIDESDPRRWETLT